MKRKQPNKHTRFAYARIPTEEGVTYRLSRRLFNGCLQFAILNFKSTDVRPMMALALWRARIELRERCDKLEMALMEVHA